MDFSSPLGPIRLDELRKKWISTIHAKKERPFEMRSLFLNLRLHALYDLQKHSADCTAA